MGNYLATLRQRVSPGLRKIFSNFSWLLVERLLSMIIALTIGLYVIRYLGVKEFGMLSYIISFVGLFDVIAKLGLDAIVVRNLVKKEDENNEIIGTAFILKLTATIISIFLSVIAIYYVNQASNNPEHYSLLILTAIVACSLIFNIFDVIDFWFQSQLLSKPMVMARLAQTIISSFIKLIFIKLHLAVFAFAWLLSVDGLMKSLGMIAMYCQEKRSLLAWKFNFRIAKELLEDSWPLILSSVMVTIYVKIDQVMLGTMATQKDVGIYAAAIRFSEIWYFIPVIICSSVFPTILKAKSQDQNFYYQRLQQLYDILMWLSLLIGLVVCLVAYPLIHWLLGDDYKQSAEILIIHIWALPFVFLGVGRNQWLVAENLTQFGFITTTLGAISNIVLNMFLIPISQGVGAAIATVISYAIAGYASCLFYRPAHPILWMLTKSLVIPFRIQHNLHYIQQIQKILQRT
ncbi:MAG: flippase [Snowella sp.]|nr:flippase [Snowella sp.]